MKFFWFSLWAALVFMLIGCGGGGGGSTPPPGVTTPFSVSLTWPERSKAIVGTSSALSARITLIAALPDGDNASFVVNRASDSAAYTDTYTSSQSVRTGVRTLRIDFYALAGAAGHLVASATVQVDVQEDGQLLTPQGEPLGTILASGVVASVTVVPDQTLEVGETVDLQATARNSTSQVVAVTAGSIFWTLETGSDFLDLEADGGATGLLAGIATVVATIDGIPSSPEEIEVTPSVLSVTYNAHDLVYDPFSGKLYAMDPASDSVVSIDPTTGVIGTPIALSGNPDVLAIADDGSYLYVAMGAAASVAKIDLATQTVVDTLVLDTIPFTVFDLRVLPGAPNSFALALNTGGVGVSIWDGAVRRTGTGAGDSIVFGADASTLYGYRHSQQFFRNAIDSTSITFAQQVNNVVDSSFVYENNRLYTARGQIVDPGTVTELGRLNSTDFLADRGVASDVDANSRVYFITWSHGLGKRILTFDATTQTQVGSFDTGVTSGGADNFVTCGNHAVAFHTFGSGITRQVVIVKGLP